MADMRSSNGSDVNWSDLCPELLVLISKKLVDVFDFVYFRATCRSWRSSTLHIDNTSQEIPWIVGISNSPNGYSLYKFSLGGLVQNKVTRLFADRLMSGMSCWQGYLLVVDDRLSIWSLVNPLTNRELPLPFLCSNNHYCRLLGIETDNNRIPEFVAIHANNLSTFATSICFCHIGDKKWTVVHNGKSIPFSACKYYKSKFFLFCKFKSEIQVYSAKTNSSVIHKFSIPRSWWLNDSCFKFCVNEGGLVVFVLRSYHTFGDGDFEVYRLENENENPQWIRTTNIGDQIIYSSYDCHISKAGKSSGFKENSIYFMRYCLDTDKDYLHRLDIESGVIEDIQCPTDDAVYSWFLPSLV